MLKKLFLLSMLGCGLAAANEGFEKAPVGKLGKVDIEYGTLTAEAGHAEIMKGHARTGVNALHILGGENRSATIELAEKLTRKTPCEFHMERWTGKAPFKVEIFAKTDAGEVKLSTIDKVGTGAYKYEGKLELPEGTAALRFCSTTPENSGILLDDIGIFAGDMKLNGVDMLPCKNYPILKRAPINPAVGVVIHAKGSANPMALNKVQLKVDKPSQVKNITLRSGNSAGTDFHGSKVYGTATPDENGNVTISCGKDSMLESGDTALWVDVCPSDESLVGSTLTFSDVSVTVGGKNLKPMGDDVTQRIGYMVAVPGEPVGNQPDGAADRPCVSFRIPGMIATRKGTLVGCFDARYMNSADLCQDIDVAVVRSTDGGQTWTAPYVGMDSGPGVDNGNGDPCILQDKKGRLWMQSLVCHFKGGASLDRSQPGFDPKETGQWEMVCSDDDGATWGKDHINITRQVKQQEWTTILSGPGNGICTSKGVIVFPAQIWIKRDCQSTICYSKDGGKTWAYGTGVPHRTSECQVVELKDGSLMLNCRNEKRQGKRIVYITRDYGKTWQEHASNNKALQEPTCQASLIAVDSKKHGNLLLFSNPKSGSRDHMTIRCSKDGGNTWNDGFEYDSRACWGYSCLSMCGPDRVGVLYEAPHVNDKNDMHGIGFLIVPLESVVSGKDVPLPQNGKAKKKR